MLCCCLCEGVYGDVMRVKILFNKKENALVQMADSTQAQLGNPCMCSLLPVHLVLVLC